MNRLLVRRIVGHSMLPTLREDQIVVAVKKQCVLGDVVIAWINGAEVIKRVTYINHVTGSVLLHGDNEADSTDSRHYGAITSELIAGVVVWPRHINGVKKTEV